MLLGRFGWMGIRDRRFAFLICGLVAIFGLGSFVHVLANDDGDPAALRSRAFRLKHLSNSEGKACLESLRIGTTVDLLPHNSLIVTAQEVGDLTKASSLLRLIDSAEAYKVGVIADWPGTQVLPSNEQIAGRGKLGAVGTLFDPPPASAAGGIIIDVHNGKVIAAAPLKAFESVRAAFAATISAPAVEAATAAAEVSTPATEAPAPATGCMASVPAGAEYIPARIWTGPPAALLATGTNAAGTEKPLVEKDAPVPLVKAESSLAIEPVRAASERSSSFFTGWGLATASAQTLPVAIASPQAVATTAEAGTEPANEETEPNTAEAGGEEVQEKSAGEGAAEDNGAGEASEDEAAAMKEASGEAADGAAEETVEGTGGEASGGKPAENTGVGAAAEAAMSDQAKNDAALMQLVKMLQESAAAEEAAAQEVQKTQAAEEAAAKETQEVQATEGAADTATQKAPPAETATTPATIVRPPLPSPKTPPVRTPPQTTATTSKIESKGSTDAGLEPASPNAEEDIQTVVVLPEKVRIIDLIELVGKQLGLNYMFDPSKVAGEVMIKIHDGKLKVKDMYALLESVLKFKNLAMIRREGNLVMIVPTVEATEYDPVLRRDASAVKPGDVIVTMIYQLQNIDTATAQQMLMQMKLGITFNAIVETQTLIVTDYAHRMSRIEEILKLVDVKGKARKFYSRKLEYLLPSEMAAKVLAIAQQMGTISITVSQEVTLATPPATPAAAGARTPTPAVRPTVVRPAPTTAKTGGDPGVYIDTDERTNRILMVGLEEDIETVNMIIDSLDVEKYGLRIIKEYPMQYVEAGDVLETMYELGIISSQPTARTSTLSSRTGVTTRTSTTRTPTTARTPVTTPAGTYTPMADPGANEPQISVRMSTNSLLVNATAEQHREIEMVIRFVDVEQQEIRTVQEYEIQYVDIQEVVDTLTELGIIQPPGTSSTARRAGTTQTPVSRVPTPAGTAAQAAPAIPEGPQLTTFETATGAEITSQQPQIAVLESTNSLLVYATPKQHETISLVVTHVDRELTATSTPYVVYALENQDPEELAATLNEIIQATVKEAPKSPESKITNAPAAASTAVPPKREKNEIQIVADPKSYSLIVYADKKNQQWISELIKELDAYRPQVHLDVTLVEITRDDKFQFDLDLVSKLGGFAAGGAMESGGLVTALLPTFPDGQVGEGSSFGGRGTAFFSDRHIQTLLEVVDSKKYGRVLARPSLLVKDNQPGEIKAEKTIYVAQQKTSIVPTTDNASTTVSDVTFQDYTSGIVLSITPHIASDKVLQLEITLDRTDFVAGETEVEVAGLKYPKPLDTVSSNLGTWAVLPDGATIILGGIETINQGKQTDKVPLLGDIPIIGGLFRGVNNTDQQSRLYVFVKATILKPGENLTGMSDIEKVSRKKREAFERDEAQFQNLQGVIPGRPPKPLEPERILEDDDYIKELNAKKEEEAVRVEVKLDSEQVTVPYGPLQSSPPDLVDDVY